MKRDDFAPAVGRTNGGIYLCVHVQPGARRAGVCGMHGDALKIAVCAQAQDGKANQALVQLVAKGLDVPKASVQLASGASSRRKRLFIAGRCEALMERLEGWLHDV